MKPARDVCCVVCRRIYGRDGRIPAADAQRCRIQIGGPVGMYACDAHRTAAEVAAAVGSSAVRAGVDTLLERKAPGLQDRIARVIRAWRE